MKIGYHRSLVTVHDESGNLLETIKLKVFDYIRRDVSGYVYKHFNESPETGGRLEMRCEDCFAYDDEAMVEGCLILGKRVGENAENKQGCPYRLIKDERDQLASEISDISTQLNVLDSYKDENAYLKDSVEELEEAANWDVVNALAENSQLKERIAELEAERNEAQGMAVDKGLQLAHSEKLVQVLAKDIQEFTMSEFSKKLSIDDIIKQANKQAEWQADG